MKSRLSRELSRSSSHACSFDIESAAAEVGEPAPMLAPAGWDPPATGSTAGAASPLRRPPGPYQGRELAVAPPSQAPAIAERLQLHMARHSYCQGDVLWQLGEPSGAHAAACCRQAAPTWCPLPACLSLQVNPPLPLTHTLPCCIACPFNVDELFFVEQGSILVEQHCSLCEGSDTAEGALCGGTPSPSSAAAAATVGGTHAQQQQWQRWQHGKGASAPVRTFEFGSSTLLGAVDFFLAQASSRQSPAGTAGLTYQGCLPPSSAQPHTSKVTCLTPLCRVLSLPRQAVASLAAEAPEALHVLQFVVLRAKFLDLSAVLRI